MLTLLFLIVFVTTTFIAYRILNPLGWKFFIWYHQRRGNMNAVEFAKRRTESKDIVALRVLSESLTTLLGSEIVDLSEGRLKKGTVYVTLQQLEERGLIISEKVDSLGRRAYRIPSNGMWALRSR